VNHTEAVVAKKVREYESLCRLVQETQRLYQSAKEAEGSPKVSHDEYMRRAFEYHEADARLERKLQAALGITEVDVEHHNYRVLNARGTK
jgi:hypothetical protein